MQIVVKYRKATQSIYQWYFDCQMLVQKLLELSPDFVQNLLFLPGEFQELACVVCVYNLLRVFTTLVQSLSLPLFKVQTRLVLKFMLLCDKESGRCKYSWVGNNEESGWSEKYWKPHWERQLPTTQLLFWKSVRMKASEVHVEPSLAPLVK